MLVLSRKLFQRIRLKDTETGKIIWLQVIDIDRGKIRLGIEAEKSVEAMREELIQPERKPA